MPIEPAMDSKISAFGSKKASENSDVVGSYCHMQVNRCAIFAWWMLVFYRYHECGMSNFNFYLNKDGKFIYVFSHNSLMLQ